MNPDQYPSVTIVAGDIATARPTHPKHGAFLKMNDGAIYIKITPAQAAQWLPVLTAVAEEK